MIPVSYIQSFADELEKIAAKVPFIHGTHKRLRVLQPGIGVANAANDPNPRAVYAAMRGRAKRVGIARFAEEAVVKRGGTPTIASGKMDTKKGWLPSQLTAWGKKRLGLVEDAQDLARELDHAPDKRARGKIWEQLNRGVGSWRNVDPSASLKVSKNTSL